MRARSVNENVSFERGKDPKRAMDIGHWGIKRALLDQGFPKADTMEGDVARSWFERGGLPEGFLEDIEYNETYPFEFTDYALFDEDYYIEYELPDWVDPDRFLSEFKRTGPKREQANTNRWGIFQWQRGELPDGTRVYYYKNGLTSGFLSKKEWLK